MNSFNILLVNHVICFFFLYDTDRILDVQPRERPRLFIARFQFLQFRLYLCVIIIIIIIQNLYIKLEKEKRLICLLFDGNADNRTNKSLTVLTIRLLYIWILLNWSWWDWREWANLHFSILINILGSWLHTLI